MDYDEGDVEYDEDVWGLSFEDLSASAELTEEDWRENDAWWSNYYSRFNDGLPTPPFRQRIIDQRSLKCLYCGQAGHDTDDCPNLKALAQGKKDATTDATPPHHGIGEVIHYYEEDFLARRHKTCWYCQPRCRLEPQTHRECPECHMMICRAGFCLSPFRRDGTLVKRECQTQKRRLVGHLSRSSPLQPTKSAMRSGRLRTSPRRTPNGHICDK